MTYSADLRQRVLGFVAAGGSKVEAAERFRVHRSTVHEWLKQPEGHQSAKPGPKGSRKFDREQLRQMVQAQPDLLIREMAQRLGVSNNAVGHALRCMKLGRKKTLRYAQAFTPQGCDKRKQYLRRRCRVERNRQSLVYMDETGFALGTHRSHGRAPRGQRVHGLQNACSRPRTSLIGAYCDNKLIAPMLFEGTCNSALFHDWLEQMLLPELVCGSVIVLDNAAFHTAKRTRRMVEEAGCELLFLPPYSPDLNPIEKLWGNLKQLRQRTGASVDELLRMTDCSWG